ncbi:MAG: heparan-alpha-glucosaminide N-acetyltransferase domain-containing protein [Bacteroidota bacterium]
MPATVATKQRIQSIDILRGVIMLIMAIDHVREYFHTGAITSDPTNLATTTPLLFFTRWITHFCAPTFVFLSGLSAYLAGTRRTKSELSGFLIKRGLWLIFVELAIISLALTLDPLYHGFALQVIWAIGISMMLLGLLARLPPRLIGTLGILIIVGHGLLANIKLTPDSTGDVLMKMFFTSRGAVVFLDKTHLVFVLYAIIPWTGVMFLGYAFGSLYQEKFAPPKRKLILTYSSVLMLLAFVGLRLINAYGDPSPWSVNKTGVYTFISFLNVSKYPPSLDYCLLTLSVGLMVLAYTEKSIGKLAAFFKVYGSVPFFYYVCHFYLIRTLSIVVFFLQGYNTSQIITPNVPFLFVPPGFGFSIGWVYLLWLAIILALYYPCKWFSKYKETHKQWWLSYL